MAKKMGNGEKKAIAGKEKSMHKDLEIKAPGILERKPVGLDHVWFILAASTEPVPWNFLGFVPISC